MSTFTIPELYWIAGQGGFTGSGQVLMTAFFVRESGGQASIIGDIDNPRAGCRSYGLGQINVCPGPGNAGNPRRSNPTLLLDPIQNAKECFALSKNGTDFGPWGYGPTAYRSGVTPPNVAAVQAEISKAGGAQKPSDAALVGTVQGQGAVNTSLTDLPGLPGLPDLSGFTTFAEKLNDPKTWQRIALIGGGTVLAAVAVGVLNMDLLKKVTGGVTGAAPAPEEPAGPTGTKKPPPIEPTAGELDELALAA